MLLLLFVLVGFSHGDWVSDVVGVEKRESMGKKPLLVVYFASSTCDACWKFKPRVDELCSVEYEEYMSVLFISRDPNAARFERHVRELPKNVFVVPYDNDGRESINDRFQRPPVPSIIALNSTTLDVIDDKGYFSLLAHNTSHVVSVWRTGQRPSLGSGTKGDSSLLRRLEL